jgi:predicted NAD/FAD-dependent oxidoreductase
VEKAYQEIKSISGLVPTQVKGQSWKNSQVHIPYDGSPGFLEISDSPPLILTGDGFSSSAMEGCISSAIKTTERLKELFNEK